MSSTLEYQSTRIRAGVPFSSGDVIGEKYEVTGVRGIGGTAFILAARHLELDQPVAIKVPHATRGAASFTAERLLHEAAALAHLRSAHVPRLFDVNRLPDGTPYVVMDLLAGLDLRELLARGGSFATDEAVGYVLQIANALSTVHAQGIVHLDIKPENIHVGLIDGAPHVTLLDFGTSKWIRPEESRAKDDCRVRGTPLYMAPERLRNETVDARADIWSLGCVLYELLAKRSPFKRTRTAQGIAATLHDEPVSIRTYRNGIKAGLEAVVLQCLRKERDERFSSVAELSCALAPHGPVDAYRLAARCCDMLSLGAPVLEELHSREVSRQPTVAWDLGIGAADVHSRSPGSRTDLDADSRTVVGHPPPHDPETRPRRASRIRRKGSESEIAGEELLRRAPSAEIEINARAQTEDVAPRPSMHRRALSRAQLGVTIVLLVSLFSILHVMFSATTEAPPPAAGPSMRWKRSPTGSLPPAMQYSSGSQQTLSDSVPATSSTTGPESLPTQAQQSPPEAINKHPPLMLPASGAPTMRRETNSGRAGRRADRQLARESRSSLNEIEVGY